MAKLFGTARKVVELVKRGNLVGDIVARKQRDRALRPTGASEGPSAIRGLRRLIQGTGPSGPSKGPISTRILRLLRTLRRANQEPGSFGPFEGPTKNRDSSDPSDPSKYVTAQNGGIPSARADPRPTSGSSSSPTPNSLRLANRAISGVSARSALVAAAVAPVEADVRPGSAAVVPAPGTLVPESQVAVMNCASAHVVADCMRRIRGGCVSSQAKRVTCPVVSVRNTPGPARRRRALPMPEESRFDRSRPA
jgi:hypothetical protein